VKLRVTTAFSLSRAENCATWENIYVLPLGKEESAEVELLPLKMEDIAVVSVTFLSLFKKN